MHSIKFTNSLNGDYFMIQSRSEETGIKLHKTLNEALQDAKEDKSIWKISFDAIDGSRVRLVRYENPDEWIYSPIES